MNKCTMHDWVELVEDIVYCRRCPAVGIEEERDVFHGDYAEAVRSVRECDDLPEFDQFVRAVAIWAVHALPTSEVERHVRDALHHALGAISEFERDIKEEYDDTMRRFSLGSRSFELSRAEQQCIVEALQQQESEAQEAYEASEDPEEAKGHSDCYDATGALLIRFGAGLDFTARDWDAEQKQISYQQEAYPTIDLPDRSSDL